MGNEEENRGRLRRCGRRDAFGRGRRPGGGALRGQIGLVRLERLADLARGGRWAVIVEDRAAQPRGENGEDEERVCRAGMSDVSRHEELNTSTRAGFLQGGR